MKKLIFVLAILAGTMFVSCGKGAVTTTADTTVVADTTVDTVAVDSIL